MSQTAQVSKTFIAGEALNAFTRVKLSASKTVSYADADEAEIGVTLAAAASGAFVPVALKGTGTLKCLANGAITENASIYGVNDGEVDDTAAASGSSAIGIALEAALAAGDVIECILNPNVV